MGVVDFSPTQDTQKNNKSSSFGLRNPFIGRSLDHEHHIMLLLGFTSNLTLSLDLSERRTRWRGCQHSWVTAKAQAPRRFRYLQGTSGFHEPCSSSLAEKNCQKRRTRSCACSRGGYRLPPARSPASPLSSGTQQLRNSVGAAEACSRSQHLVDVWAFALRPPLAAGSCQ